MASLQQTIEHLATPTTACGVERYPTTASVKININIRRQKILECIGLARLNRTRKGFLNYPTRKSRSLR
jgi:hypothetical protein